MKRRCRVQGFTLAELIVSMLLASMLVASACIAYRYINQSFITYNDTSSGVAQIYRSLGLIENEVWQSDSVISSHDNIIFYEGGCPVSVLQQSEKTAVFTKGSYRDTIDILKIEAIPFEEGKTDSKRAGALYLQMRSAAGVLTFKIAVIPAQIPR